KAGRIKRIGVPRDIITEEMLAHIYSVRANIGYDAAGLPLVDYRTEQTL
ncbi:MAG: ABC transporter, partial [Selenomonas sp.]|nr:ABC transporter [Selenomonas sp.]